MFMLIISQRHASCISVIFMTKITKQSHVGKRRWMGVPVGAVLKWGYSVGKCHLTMNPQRPLLTGVAYLKRQCNAYLHGT
jgi:hypothetical protein